MAGRDGGWCGKLRTYILSCNHDSRERERGKEGETVIEIMSFH